MVLSPLSLNIKPEHIWKIDYIASQTHLTRAGYLRELIAKDIEAYEHEHGVIQL